MLNATFIFLYKPHTFFIFKFESNGHDAKTGNFTFASQRPNALLTRSQLNQPVVLKWSGATVAQLAG